MEVPLEWGTPFSGAKVGGFAALEVLYGSRKGISIVEVPFFKPLHRVPCHFCTSRLLRLKKVRSGAMTGGQCKPRQQTLLVSGTTNLIHLFHLSCRKVWLKPNIRDADRQHPAAKPEIINLCSVIMWFEMPEGLAKFNLPDNVVNKLEQYAFCLFDA
jgi:hypothetical protein